MHCPGHSDLKSVLLLSAAHTFSIFVRTLSSLRLQAADSELLVDLSYLSGTSKALCKKNMKAGPGFSGEMYWLQWKEPCTMQGLHMQNACGFDVANTQCTFATSEFA